MSLRFGVDLPVQRDGARRDVRRTTCRDRRPGGTRTRGRQQSKRQRHKHDPSEHRPSRRELPLSATRQHRASAVVAPSLRDSPTTPGSLTAHRNAAEGYTEGRNATASPGSRAPFARPSARLPRPVPARAGRAAAVARRLRAARGARLSASPSWGSRARCTRSPTPARAGSAVPRRRSTSRGLAPRDVWGHDVLWWLDRMVRTKAPLVERMTLVWHDWFATSKAGVDGSWMLRQNALLRDQALGNFRVAPARGHEGPGDADLAQRHREQRGRAERELRPRAAGAVHARRRAAATPRATCARWRERSRAGARTGATAPGS